jgi:GNAT superfamily N-acetyltransferase
MIIRKATLEGSEAITPLLMLATGEVIYKFIGEKNYLKAMAFLFHFVKSEDNQYSYQNCYVAEEDGTIVGAILGYQGADLKALRKPVTDFIHQNFDENLKAEDETQAGEFYIDSLGVSPDHQGKGIGSQLLQFVIAEATEDGGTIGLLVDKANPQAKKLYLNLGFVPVGEKTLLGISLEHLQLRGK